MSTEYCIYTLYSFEYIQITAYNNCGIFNSTYMQEANKSRSKYIVHPFSNAIYELYGLICMQVWGIAVSYIHIYKTLRLKPNLQVIQKGTFILRAPLLCLLWLYLEHDRPHFCELGQNQ